MKTEALSDRELQRIHGELARAVAEGDPLTEGVRKYGIRDLSSLGRWIKKIEAELESRGIDYRPVPLGR